MKITASVVSDVPSGSQVDLEFHPASSCRHCAKGRGCGAGIVAVGQPVRLTCLSSCSLQKGQKVVIEPATDSSRWLYLVLGAYGLPTVGLIVGAFWAGTTDDAATADMLSALGGAIGLVVGLITWYWVQPYVNRLVEKGACLRSARIVDVKPLESPSIVESSNAT